MDLPFTPPPVSESDESLEYRVRPRPKPQFHSVHDAQALFGRGDPRTRVRLRSLKGECALHVAHDLGEWTVEEVLDAKTEAGLVATRLVRTTRNALEDTVRREVVEFDRGPIPTPRSAYPEVMLPFLMRWVPRDRQRRACYAWTNDRFIARVYYELRRDTQVEVNGARRPAQEVWMYPDLNDWIALGGVLTKLAKPLLPRYTMWFEPSAPHRLLRFEGPYGPPGAPEIILELV